MLIPLGIWAASGAGGGASGTDFQLISTQVLASTANSVTFSSIPSTFRHLQLRTTMRDSFGSGYYDATVTMNGVTSASYAYHYLQGGGASVNSGGSGSVNGMYPVVYPANAITSGVFGAMILDVLDYAQTSKNKTIRSLGGVTATSAQQVKLSSGFYNSTSAVTSLTITSGGSAFQVGSRFSLYGWN
jgi:hypothetical protein